MLTAKLEEMGQLHSLKYIVNTHWHGDHTEGNMALGKQATIVAHDNVRQRLMTTQEVKIFNMTSNAYPKHALPDITYSNTMNLYFNDETLELHHFSHGHTDGDSVIFFKRANVVHMGDHYFNGFFPFVDTGTGGNVVTMAANVKKVLTLIDNKTVVIPGHGAVSNKQELAAFHAMLIGTTAEVKAMKDQGLSLKAIQQQGLNKKWHSWTQGFLSADTWITIIDASL